MLWSMGGATGQPETLQEGRPFWSNLSRDEPGYLRVVPGSESPHVAKDVLYMAVDWEFEGCYSILCDTGVVSVIRQDLSHKFCKLHYCMLTD